MNCRQELERYYTNSSWGLKKKGEVREHGRILAAITSKSDRGKIVITFTNTSL